MKKLIILLVKLLPIFTIYKGFSGGHNRLAPLVNIGKVILTQKEMSGILQVYSQNFKDVRGRLISQSEFTSLIRDYYEDEYTILIREFLENEVDMAKDAWGEEYLVEYDDSLVTIFSKGPDRESYTRDDVKVSFNAVGAKKRKRKRNKNSRIMNIEKNEENDKKVSEEVSNNRFDEEGFDGEGFDRSGFDSDGFNRDGYDREGFDRNGYNNDGYSREELREREQY